MLSIIIGLCLLCFGIIGITRNWWAVLDFVRIVIPVGLLVLGVISVLAGLSDLKKPSTMKRP